MRNKLIDLNNHLFAEMERLSDEALKGDDLKQEIERSKAISNVARGIIDNGKLVLDAQKALGDNVITTIPEMIGTDDK